MNKKEASGTTSGETNMGRNVDYVTLRMGSPRKAKEQASRVMEI